MPVWLIQIIVGIVFSVASTLLEQAERNGSANKTVAGYRDTVQTGGKNPQSFVIGTFGLAGKLEYDNTWGTEGDTPNAYRTQVISLGDLPITALTGLYEASQAVTLTTSGHVAQGYPVAERTSSGADYFWQEFHDGTQTTADSFLLSTFGSDTVRPWTPDMVGRGIPYVTLTALYNQNVWTSAPSCMFEVQGIPLYDPRKDSSAGGSGAQRLNDQSTWAWSENAIVAIYNILVGIRYDNAIVWGGSVAQSQLPYANWAAAMDAADAAVPLAVGGTEPAFRIGREVLFNERPADVIGDFLVASNARISEAAGVYTILVGVPTLADGAFTDADVIITEATQLDPFPNLDSTVNGGTASYLEPLQAWESKDTAPYYRSDLEAADRGFRLTQGLTLDDVFSGTQAQRILKATVEEGRRFVKHAVPLVPVFGTYRPLQALGWTSSQNGYSGKLFLVTSWIEATNGNVTLGLQEIDPADHDWTPETDEKPLSFAPLTPVVPPAQAIKGWSVEPATILNSDDAAIAPAIKVNFDGSQADVDQVHVKVRLASSGVIFFSTDIRYGTPTTGTKSEILSSPAFASNTEYEVQGQFIPFSGRQTTPSDWLAVTTPDVATGVENVLLSQLSAEVRAALTWGGQSAREQMRAIQDAALHQASQDWSNYTDVEAMYDLLESTTDDLTAGIAEARLVATSTSSALAEFIQSVYANFGGDETGFNFRVSASYSPAAGYDARMGLELYSDIHDVWQSVGFFGELNAAGGRLILVGDQVVIAKSDGTLISLFDGQGQIVNGLIRGPGTGNFWNLGSTTIGTIGPGDFRVSNT